MTPSVGAVGTPRASARRRRLLLTGAALALGASLQMPAPAQARPAACGVPPREPLPFAWPDPTTGWSTPARATVTRIEWTPAGYTYLVDGQPTMIRGMGYNPPAQRQSREERVSRLQRDLGLMATAGVNTLIGWNPAVMDGVTLDAAYETGLGVILPFDIDFTQDLRQAATRDALTAGVLRWVDQHREHPALRMWGIGNEVLQRSVPPAWCTTLPDPAQSTWADAWSDLVVSLADEIHARDPQHPVLYREAEDSYTPWLARALARRPADRPWLVYGINAYTPRLAEILDGWAARGIPSPVLVSELAPLDAPRGQRADGFREMWGVVRARSSLVLGGAVYVWSTDGPEEVDRAFGLVDEHGDPVDDALDTIRQLYREDG